MAIKKYKPTSPGSRQRVSIDYKRFFLDLKNTIILVIPQKPGEILFSLPCFLQKIFWYLEKGGRANTGRLTVYTKGGGHKKV